MKIVVASDSYKGCLSSAQVAVAMQSAILAAHPELAAMGFASIYAATPSGMFLKDAIKPEVAAKNIFNTVTSII